MTKLAVTVCDVGDVVHAGGEPHRTTSIIELREDQIPRNLREYLAKVEKCREWQKQYGMGHGGYTYASVVISLVDEDGGDS